MANRWMEFRRNDVSPHSSPLDERLPKATEVPPENSLALSKYQAENAALRMALYEAVKHDMVLKV